MGGYFASSRHGGEGRISEKNTTLRVVFLERATRLELASRHPTNGCRHSQEPCLTSDQTCFAQVEAATSSLPAVSFQKRKSHPDGWDFLFWSGRRGSNSLPGIPRMALAIRRSPASPLDLMRFAQVEAASSPVLRHIPRRIPHPVGWGILLGAGDEARTRFPASHEWLSPFAGALPHLLI